uniref:Uncharacterized protein n=1 Tax=Moniliophthora roreri TaxID=221103 RepID=A0A0W0FTJ1_MONRR
MSCSCCRRPRYKLS